MPALPPLEALASLLAGPELPLALLVVALATVAQAVTGFGFALVLVPLLALLYEPRTVVVVSLSLGLLSKLPLLLLSWRQVQPRRIAPLCLSALVGALAGTRLLLQADGDALRLGIGLLVVALATPLLLERRRPARREGLAALAVGLVSGALNGATSMGGPPVVLLGANQGWEKESFRANLIAYFAVVHLGSLALLILASGVTADALRLDLTLAPAVPVGLLAGGALFPRLPAARFRRLVVLLVVASGLLAAVGGARAYLG